MKFSLLTLSCIACAPSKTLALNLRPKELSSRNLNSDKTCTVVLVDTLYGNDNMSESREHLSIECHTTDGMIYEVPSATTEFIQDNFIDGDFVSGETEIILGATNNIVEATTIQPLFTSTSSLMKTHLAEATTGDFTVLAIRVEISDGQTTANEDSIRDGIFGTDGDPQGDAVNLKSQYSRCSYNQLNFDSVGTIAGNTLTINDGVITINLPNSKKSDGNSAIRSAINAAIQNDFNMHPSQIADKVMYCLPSGTMSGIAFAGVGSWYSVYNDEWCGYSAVQMHEIGHNLRLAHAGDGTNQYGDQSGNMGYSYRQDDTSMCFNAAKSWQLGWYSQRTFTINAPDERVYEGELAGIVENPFTVSNVPILIKLDTTSSNDYYINFNRKTSFNSGTREGANQVMITKAGAEGNGYSPSLLLAKLSANSSWESPADFNGETVTVTVNSIGTRANVKICVGTCSPVSDIPTASPSASPIAVTDAPTQAPVTNPPTKSPVALPTPSPVNSPTSSPQQEQYEQTYSFPPTDTNEFVHGICVMGASSAIAFSDTDVDLDYTVVPEFKDGINLWSDRDYTAQGIQGDGMCEGGIYLKPSRHKTIDRYTDITFGANSIDGNYVSMCVFLNDDDNRDGNWKEVLLSDRFKVSEQFIFTNGRVEGKMRSYCKTIPDPPTSAPSEAPTRTDMDVSYTFPQVQTTQFVHALCVKGASDAWASSTDSNLSYTSVANFQDGMKFWDDRNYEVSGVAGDAMCEGGIYLRPSRHKTIDRYTDITFGANSIDGNDVSMCVFLNDDDNRDGDWKEVLLSDRFMVSEQFIFTNGSVEGKMRSYCKSIPS